MRGISQFLSFSRLWAQFIAFVNSAYSLGEQIMSLIWRQSHCFLLTYTTRWLISHLGCVKPSSYTTSFFVTEFRDNWSYFFGSGRQTDLFRERITTKKLDKCSRLTYSKIRGKQKKSFYSILAVLTAAWISSLVYSSLVEVGFLSRNLVIVLRRTAAEGSGRGWWMDRIPDDRVGGDNDGNSWVKFWETEMIESINDEEQIMTRARSNLTRNRWRERGQNRKQTLQTRELLGNARLLFSHK